MRVFSDEKKICSGIWSIVILLLLTEPVFFQHIWTKRLFQAAIMAAFAVIFLFYVGSRWRDYKAKSERKSSKVIYVLVAYYAYLLLRTYMNGGPAFSCFFRCVQFGAIILYFDMLARNNPKALFSTWLNIMTVYVVANLLTVLIFPSGLYSDEYYSNNYLLGYDNQNINFILPMLIFVLLKHFYYKPCLVQIIVSYAVSLANALITWSGASIIMIVLMSAFAVIFLVKNRTPDQPPSGGKLLNLFNLLLVNMVAWVLLIVGNIQLYFNMLVEKILHKTLDLTGRVDIWQRSIEWIGKNPIFGYGQERAVERAVKMGYRELSPRGLHAHNRFLETMYQGGVILLAMYLFVLLFAAYCLGKVKETPFAKILAFGIFVYLTGMLTEVYTYSPFFWPLLVLAENAPGFIKRHKEGQERELPETINE